MIQIEKSEPQVAIIPSSKQNQYNYNIKKKIWSSKKQRLSDEWCSGKQNDV